MNNNTNNDFKEGFYSKINSKCTINIEFDNSSFTINDNKDFKLTLIKKLDQIDLGSIYYLNYQNNLFEISLDCSLIIDFNKKDEMLFFKETNNYYKEPINF